MHIGGTSMFLAYDRIALVDFLSMTTNTMAGFVFRTPPLSYTSNIYYLPFSSTVWICSILLVMLSTVIIYITFKYSLNVRAKDEGHSTNPTSDFVLAAISAVCQMGPDLYPKKISGRISSVKYFYTHLGRCSLFSFLFANLKNRYFSGFPCYSFIRHTRQILWHCCNHHRMQSIHWKTY